MRDTKEKDKPFKGTNSHSEEMQLAFTYLEGISNPTNVIKYPPTIDEMRRVARYLSQEMGQYSAAGKLFVKADLLERVVEEYMRVKKETEKKQ